MFWTPERRAAAIAEIYIGVAMAKAAGVEAGSPSGITFKEAPEEATMRGKKKPGKPGCK